MGENYCAYRLFTGHAILHSIYYLLDFLLDFFFEQHLVRTLINIYSLIMASIHPCVCLVNGSVFSPARSVVASVLDFTSFISGL